MNFQSLEKAATLCFFLSVSLCTLLEYVGETHIYFLPRTLLIDFEGAFLGFGTCVCVLF